MRLSLGLSLESGAGSLFNGNFASIFTNAFQSVQTDLGFSYGTLLPAGTTPPTIVQGGSLNPGLPIRPILIKTATTGALNTWTANVYIDGTGTTIDQTFTSASTVNLTGNLAGITLAISAGLTVSGDQWTATCSQLLDQSGNGKHYTQATASKQPVVTVGVNGKIGLLGDGVATTFVSSLNLPAPATTPYTIVLIGKQVTWTSATTRLVGGTSGNNPAIRQVTASPQIQQVGAANANISSGMTVGSFAVVTAFFNNATTDYLRAGSAASATGSSAGSTTTTGREIFSAIGASFSNLEFLAAVYVPGQINESVLRASATRLYGSTVLT